jgi:hypothetical protein
VARTIIELVAPLVAEARGLVELRRRLTGPFPAADSASMSERLDDATLVDIWSGQPVTDAQNYVVKLVCVAEDHLECVCRLLDRPDFVPVWGLAPCARSLLEAAGRAVCLASPDLDARGRVEAYMNERLFALDQIANLPPEARDSPAVVEQRQEILDSAPRHGFKRRPHPVPGLAAVGKLAKPPQLGGGREGDIEAVRRLFASLPEMGKGAFQWLSAAAHATAWEVEKPFRSIGTNAVGITSIELSRDPREVCHIASMAVMGYVEMVGQFLSFWGAEHIDWHRAALNAIRIRNSVAGVVEGSAQV